jgi:hypothetical protein
VQRIQTSRISVYVHFPQVEGYPRSRVSDVVTYLEGLGYSVPDTRAVANVRSLNEVRYYHTEDREAAEALALDTARLLERAGAERTQIRARDFTDWQGAKPRRGVVELWL